MELVHATQLVRGGARMQTSSVCSKVHLPSTATGDTTLSFTFFSALGGTELDMLDLGKHGLLPLLAEILVYFLDPSLRIQSSLKRACCGK